MTVGGAGGNAIISCGSLFVAYGTGWHCWLVDNGTFVISGDTVPSAVDHRGSIAYGTGWHCWVVDIGTVVITGDTVLFSCDLR